MKRRTRTYQVQLRFESWEKYLGVQEYIGIDNTYTMKCYLRIQIQMKINQIENPRRVCIWQTTHNCRILRALIN